MRSVDYVQPIDRKISGDSEMLHRSLAIVLGMLVAPLFAGAQYEYEVPAQPLPSGGGSAVSPGALGGPGNGFAGPGAANPGFGRNFGPGPNAGPGLGPNFGGPNAGPGFGPNFGGGPNAGSGAGPNVGPGPGQGPAEIRIEVRQPEWREYPFTGSTATEQSNQFAERAREMGYEIHLEHYRDRSRVACRMTEWTIYATVYRPERAQQMRTWLETQGLETRNAADAARSSAPPTATPPAIPPYGSNRASGGSRFGLDPNYGGSGLPQAW